MAHNSLSIFDWNTQLSVYKWKYCKLNCSESFLYQSCDRQHLRLYSHFKWWWTVLSTKLLYKASLVLSPKRWNYLSISRRCVDTLHYPVSLQPIFHNTVPLIHTRSIFSNGFLLIIYLCQAEARVTAELHLILNWSSFNCKVNATFHNSLYCHVSGIPWLIITGSGLDDWIYWRLLCTVSLNYKQSSAIADLHNLQFTVTYALGFSVFTSHILVTGLKQSVTKFSNHSLLGTV
jgi:hypothetical protein